MLYPIQNGVRNKLDISGIWDFRIDPDHIGEAEGWANGLDEARPMAVPGSWNEQYDDLFGYLDLAWYVKKVYVPSGWKDQRILLRVGSAVYFAVVYVNGTPVGTHEGGHLPFAFDITDHVRWGEENVVAISVENELRPDRVPSGNMPGQSITDMIITTPRTTYDFYPFCGIHRPVVLYSVPQTHIEDVTVVTTIDGSIGVVQVKVKLNAAAGGQGSVELKGGDAVYKADLTFADSDAVAELRVPNAHLWSDKDPYLYDLTVSSDTDQYALKVGIRTIAVDGGKILLNGQPVKMNGFGRHEDFPASGKGLNLPLIVKDYQLMRWTERERLPHLALPLQRGRDADGGPRGLPHHRRDSRRQPADGRRGELPRPAAHVPAADRRDDRARQESPGRGDVVRGERTHARRHRHRRRGRRQSGTGSRTNRANNSWRPELAARAGPRGWSPSSPSWVAPRTGWSSVMSSA